MSDKDAFNCRFIYKKNDGHAATLLVYFIFWGGRAEGRTRGCLTAARRATCGQRRHPDGLRRHPEGLRRHPMGYAATLRATVGRHPKGLRDHP